MYLQVPQQEQEEPAGAASAPEGLASGPRVTTTDTGRIIAVSAYACNSPGGAINGSAAVDAITTIPLQVGIDPCMPLLCIMPAVLLSHRLLGSLRQMVHAKQAQQLAKLSENITAPAYHGLQR
mgnify:CR=1 FL=1